MASLFLRRMISPMAIVRVNFSTVNISAALVKELREKSGAAMMDCKKALSSEEVNGDMAKAMDWLRAKGKARASSNSDRIASEGLIALLHNKDSRGFTLVEVNSETDFVSRNKDFQQFVASVASSANQNHGKGEIKVADLLSHSGGTLQESLDSIVLAIRENIIVRRVRNITPATADIILSGYVHNKVGTDFLPAHIQMGKAAGLVAISTTGLKAEDRETVEQAGRKLAMHVFAASPQYLSAAAVPADVTEREVAISKEQALAEGKAKSDAILDRIVQGKVQKRLAEISLLSQAHMAEEGNPVVSKFLGTLSTQLKSQVDCVGFTKWGLGQSAGSDL